jgi:hypothetical protein
LPGLASLAPCALSGCPLRPATAGPGSPGPSRLADRGPVATSALLACLQQHDTARDKIIFAGGPCRSAAPQGMRPHHLLTGGSGPFLSRRPAEGTNLRVGRSTAGNATWAGEDQRRRGTRTSCSAPPGCDELTIDPQRIIDPARGATVLTSRAVVRAAQRMTSDIRRSGAALAGGGVLRMGHRIGSSARRASGAVLGGRLGYPEKRHSA